jgi:hypothetical protein
MIRLAGYLELAKAVMDGIGMVRKIGVLCPEVFPTKAVSKGSDISNQEIVIKLWEKESPLERTEVMEVERDWEERLTADVQFGVSVERRVANM